MLESAGSIFMEEFYSADKCILDDYNPNLCRRENFELHIRTLDYRFVYSYIRINVYDRIGHGEIKES
jgi:hypothetical protein